MPDDHRDTAHSIRISDLWSEAIWATVAAFIVFYRQNRPTVGLSMLLQVVTLTGLTAYPMSPLRNQPTLGKDGFFAENAQQNYSAGVR